MQLFLQFLTLCLNFTNSQNKVSVFFAKTVYDYNYLSFAIRKPTVTALNSGP